MGTKQLSGTYKVMQSGKPIHLACPTGPAPTPVLSVMLPLTLATRGSTSRTSRLTPRSLSRSPMMRPWQTLAAPTCSSMPSQGCQQSFAEVMHYTSCLWGASTAIYWALFATTCATTMGLDDQKKTSGEIGGTVGEPAGCIQDTSKQNKVNQPQVKYVHRPQASPLCIPHLEHQGE